MKRGSRRAPSKLLRLLALGWLAFVLVTQPVIAALGQMHETFEHGGVALVDHLDHEHAHAAVGVDATGVEESPSALHELSHLIHCCGQPTAADIAGVELSQVHETRALTGLHAVPTRFDVRRNAPYRPPISA